MLVFGVNFLKIRKSCARGSYANSNLLVLVDEKLNQFLEWPPRAIIHHHITSYPYLIMTRRDHNKIYMFRQMKMKRKKIKLHGQTAFLGILSGGDMVVHVISGQCSKKTDLHACTGSDKQ